MLPRKLYELLPYLYIGTGVVCAILIDSTIVLISSMLLIVAGVFVLLMRRNFRKSINRDFQQYQAAYDPAFNDVERRSGFDRRQRERVEWSVLDDAGVEILADRRIGERRMSVV